MTTNGYQGLHNKQAILKSGGISIPPFIFHLLASIYLVN
jgi:hypothetical protein